MNEANGDVPDARPRWAGVVQSLILPLGLLAVILGGLWYWDSRGGGGIEDAYGVVELPEAKNPTGRSPAPEVGRAGPDFLLEQPGGGTLRLSDLQGQPIVLNFWASWCAPCRAEMPDLVRAYAEYRKDGLEIVAVNLQETNDQVLKFAEEFGIEFPIAIDRDGELKDIWRLGGPIDGIPTSYFLDEAGVLQDITYGPLTDEMLAERIGLLLEGTS
ncbi:MAG: redoxin domain-containing protein [Chloroflexi bacterium]|nr:redoxin domain-containing protein [Chloroflexota bacterium]